MMKTRLAGVEPKGPLCSKVLSEDGKHALDGTQDCAVDNHGTLHLALLRLELEPETNGQLEVELDGGTLELSPQRIVDGNVDLGAVESPVAVIDRPCETSRVESIRERSLCFIPHL